MRHKIAATLTSKGQITLPLELRRRWGLQSGDVVDFVFEDDDRVLLMRKKRRSILRSRDDLAPLSLGRPVTQDDIDRAIGEAMAAQDLRVRRETGR